MGYLLDITKKQNDKILKRFGYGIINWLILLLLREVSLVSINVLKISVKKVKYRKFPMLQKLGV